MSELCKCGHAEDHHFTPRLGGRCFRHECECVAFEAPNADRDDLAAILAKHWHQYPMQTHDGYHPNACSCGEPIDDPGILAPLSEAMAIHRAHVAQMVLESDWLRERDASKWAEGVQYMAERCVDEHGISANYRLGDNPYRADRVNTEDTHTQPETETEDRWCPTCQKYRPTIDDECTECGTDT